MRIFSSFHKTKTKYVYNREMCFFLNKVIINVTNDRLRNITHLEFGLKFRDPERKNIKSDHKITEGP